MSASPHPRPAHPFFRQAACFIIGFGCLLAAGTVLSSVMKAPIPHHQERGTRPAYPSMAMYALPIAPDWNAAPVRPLEALVRFQRGELRITNNSCYPWRNVRVQFGEKPSQEVHSPACALIVPYQTCTIPLERVSLSTRPDHCRHPPFSLRWECRTSHGNSKWCAYLAQ